MSNNNKGKALDNVSGSNDEDLVTGTGSAEKVDAKAAADVAAGGAGDDWVKGGSGDDSIDGGAGSDQVDGGSGNDRLLYTVGENTGETDSYDGGSGANTLVLTMTKAEWMRDDVQADIAAYLLFLASTAPSANGQNSSAGFLFSSLGLTARRFTSLEVLVDGVPQDPRDEAIVARDDESVTSTEHSVVVGNVTDNDDVPDLVRAVELVAGPDKGSLVLNQDGSYVYDPGNAFDSLAEGETAEISFTYKVSDADRDSATATARITIVGTNDAPIANVDIGTTDENQTLVVDALANDTDVDTSDTHTVQSAVIASGLGAVAIVNNQIEWTPGTDYDYLALNESATVTVDYVMGDDKGATDSSTLTITVVGSNDAPVANADTASADENQTLMVDVLVNDTDVDASDTHTLQSVTLAAGPGGTDLKVNQETKSAALGVSQGAVAIVDNQIEWNPGADFDHLALNETAMVVIDYTMSDNNGATDSSTLTLTVTGLNDAPTVLAPLSQTASEEDSPFTLDLLSGAVDVDRGAVLNVSNLTIADGQGGWVLEGNTLRVDPHHFDDLSTGDLETLTFNYNVVDQHGAAVAQTLTLNIEGFTDAPSLAAEASAAPAVNEIRLRIASEPANSERVVLTFANLPSGAVVRNAAGVAVTGGVDNFVGTHEFLVTLPPNVDTNIDLGIIVTGYKPDGTPIASKTGYIDLVYEHTSVSDAVTFSSNNQGIWASGPAPMVQWHEYIPLVGGVTKVWVAEEDGEGHWEDTGTGTWTSGEFSLFSASVSAEDAIDIALTVPRSVLDAAKTVYNTLVKAGQDAFDYAWGVYLDASSTANNIFNGAVQTAWNVFNSVVGTTVAVATKAAYDIYNGAVKVAADIRDAALVADFLDWFTGAIWDTYHFAESVARKALNLALDAVEGIAEGARVVLNEAIEAARVIKDGAIDLAGKALNLARDAFNLVKEGASATLGLAQQAYDAIANELNKVQGETSVDINAELFAEVGVQIDFVLDSGSVDTEVHYDLASTLQHNRTTDMLAITPMLINRTTGDAVAFATISPNASLKAVLLYDVGADLRVLLDSNLVVAGTTLWDITPGGTPINIGTTVTTGGWGPDFENFKSGIMDLAGDINFNGVAVGELVLVDFDTTALDQYEVPFIGTLTEDIVTLEVGFPTIQTEGKAATYTSGYFNEGGLIAVDITEVTQSILNLVNAKIDLSPELRDELNLGSLQDAASFADLVALVGEAFLGTIFAALDGQSESMPIFLLDANDATDTSLIHANLIPDWVIGNTVTADTAKYGFFTTYGESNELVRVTIDIDQAVAVIVNKIVEAAAAAGTSGATVQFLQALPDVNPLDLEFGLAEILKAVEAPQSMIDQITKFFDLSIGFEAADLDVYSALKFSQEFTLSLDDVEYEVTMEDDAVYRFAANADGNLVIENASQHDANGDGVVDYDINLVPKAMFSNDTEIGLTIGYVIDFLQASLAADLKLPLGELLNISIPGNPDIKLNLADVNLGPLLRIQGDLDLASADIFESRFNIDIGSDTVSGNYALPEEELVTLVGVMPA